VKVFGVAGLRITGKKKPELCPASEVRYRHWEKQYSKVGSSVKRYFSQLDPCSYKRPAQQSEPHRANEEAGQKNESTQ